MSPKVFVSHSSLDKEIVRQLATEIRAEGIEAWFDEWEIQPGDSVVEKINVGIQECQIFIIVISHNSVASKWVQEELNAATIRRIQENAHIIPVRLDASEVPPLLATLHYIDLANYQTGFKKLIDTILKREIKPPLGPSPWTTPDTNPFRLTNFATEVAKYLFLLDDDGLQDRFIDARQLLGKLQMNEIQIEDALNELHAAGLATIDRTNFGARVGPTFNTPRALVGTLDYDPKSDELSVMREAARNGDLMNCEHLLSATEIPLPRLNRAVMALKAQGLLHVITALGTAPKAFLEVQSNYATRKFLREHT